MEENKEIINAPTQEPEVVENKKPTIAALEPILTKEDIEDADEEIAALNEEIENAKLYGLVKLARRVDNEIEEWVTSRQLLDELDKYEKDAYNAKLMKSNILDHITVKRSLEEFNRCYEPRLNALKKAKERIVERYKEVGGEEVGTKYLSEEVLMSIDEKMKKIPEDSSNYDYYRRKMDVVTDAFSNRTDISRVVESARRYFVDHQLRSIKFSISAANRALEAKQMPPTFVTLTKHFGIRPIESTIRALMKIFDDVDYVMLTMIFFAHNHTKGVKNMTNAYLKSMILCFNDIENGIFDIGDPEEYYEAVRVGLIGLLKETKGKLGGVKIKDKHNIIGKMVDD